jgi:hypothetical protein
MFYSLTGHCARAAAGGGGCTGGASGKQEDGLRKNKPATDKAKDKVLAAFQGRVELSKARPCLSPIPSSADSHRVLFWFVVARQLLM